VASQEITGPSSQRFGAQTSPVIESGDADSRLGTSTPHAPTLLVIDSQDMDVDIVGDDARVGGGGANISKDGARVARSHKGTFTATLDFDDFDDDVFDEEVENAKASRLTESTINVNTGEKVPCQLEKGVSTGYFVVFLSSVFFV